MVKAQEYVLLYQCGMMKVKSEKKVLIVDDNPDILVSVKEGLEAMDKKIEVIPVNSGEECLSLLMNKKFLPDVILLDIMLPGMTGWEVYTRLREKEEWKSIPVVFITARTDHKAKEIGTFLGEDYIEKPFEIDELKVRIERVLRRKGV